MIQSKNIRKEVRATLKKGETNETTGWVYIKREVQNRINLKIKLNNTEQLDNYEYHNKQTCHNKKQHLWGIKTHCKKKRGAKEHVDKRCLN